MSNNTNSLLRTSEINEQLLKPEYFELDKDYTPVIYNHRLYHILHKSRAIESAIVNEKEKDEFVSSTYLLKDSETLLEIPHIKTVPNFDVLHSIEEITTHYSNLVSAANDEVKRLMRIRDRVVTKARENGIPEINKYGYTKLTTLAGIEKDRKKQ